MGAAGIDLSRSQAILASPSPPQVGAPSTVMSPQPAAREGGGSEEEDEGEGPCGIRYRDGGHLPRTRPAAGSGAASRSSRGLGRPPQGPRQTKLLPWLAPAGRAPLAPATSLSGRWPCPGSPGAAATAAGAASAASASAASLPPGSAHWPRRGRAGRGRARTPHWSTHQAGVLWSLPSAVLPPPTLSFTTRLQDGLTRSPSGGRARSWAFTAPHQESAVQRALGSAFAVAGQMDRGDLTARLSSEQGPHECVTETRWL